MTVYDRIEKLRKEKKISQGNLEKELGFSNGSISKWKTSMPKPERLQKVADYFGVTLDYLMTGKDKDGLTDADNKDIAKDLENIKRKLMNKEDGPASFDGTDIPEEDIEMFAGQIEIMLRRLKTINKEKYNPNKNKK